MGVGYQRPNRANWQQDERMSPHIWTEGGSLQLGGTSRMSREAHVRSCERLWVKLSGPTRPLCAWWCNLKSTGLEIGTSLWETVCMTNAQIRAGQVVVLDGMVGVYRVVRVSPDGQTADVEKFNISTQKSLGDPVRSVAINKLSAYKEDATQAAARIAREAITED
jgi:hypothetical protein